MPISPLQMSLSIVVPVFKSTTSVTQLVERLHTSLDSRYNFEILLVEDGSSSESWANIESIASKDDTVRGIRLGRNFGQHSAVLAGLRMARFPITITMDDDLQHSPSDIPSLVNTLQESGFDVVYGSVRQRSTSIPRRISSSVTRKILNSILGVDNAPELSSFRAFRTDLREAIAIDVGPNVQIDALLAWGTDKFGSVEVEHHVRPYGSSSYSARKLVRFALDSVTGYSIAPLQFASLLGFITAIVGLGILGYAISPAVFGGGSVPGFPFLAAAVTIFSGAQLIALGIIGEYIARMHFRVMRKPTYFISSSTSVPET